MKTTFGFLLCIGALSLLPLLSASGQERPPVPDIILNRVGMPFFPPQPRSESLTRLRIAGKMASQYTAEDWGKLIDSTWGPGQTSAEQLNVFDTFWNMVDRQWSGFPNLPLNWDSLRNVYRPQIGSGLSRGRFYALMSRLWLAATEHHTFLFDLKVDTTYGAGTTWHYKSGVPLMVIGTGWWDLLGAPVTPMPDSSGLVYRVSPGNPLGLEPGDLVLGYERIPWKRLHGQLLDSGVPVSRVWSSPGSTPESRTHHVLSAVGWNWGLFDTIDVVKYSTGDTLHLPTAPLATITQTVWASDQVPVAGVPMPQGAAGTTPTVSWGVVQGTNIGYVYAWDWYTPGTPQLFHDAIYDLRYNKKVEGLVLDFRLNWGGYVSYAYAGLSQLFNFDPTSSMAIATRNSVSNHLGFSVGAFSAGYFAPTADLFDRPIAVLIGPACLSAGDYTAFWMRFHPMARSFGRPTEGAFVGGSYITGTIPDAWPYQIPTNIAYSNVPGEGNLIHKAVLPDEEVWLTRDGVAKGEDDVVKRALQWITTLSYARNVLVSRLSIDTVRITARVENPLAHAVSVVATLNNGSGGFIDSLYLADDGLHGDSASADGLWGCQYVPARDDTLSVSIRTDDQTAGTSRRLPNVVTYVFTRGALISADTRTVDLGRISVATSQYDTTFVVRNIGYAADSLTVSLDPVNVVPDIAVSAFPDTFMLAPGDSQKVTFRIHPNLLSSQYYQALVIVEPKHAFGATRFEKSYLFQVVISSISDVAGLPRAYSVEQNYPNPFNPTTAIRYGLPQKSDVQLEVFNTLGQQVATLVSGEQEAGYHEVKFDASGLSSGVYFYRIHAGSFVQARKLLLLR